MNIKNRIVKIISIVVVSLTILVAIGVSMARVLTPRIADYDEKIIAFLHDLIEHPVSLESIEAEWVGFGPVIYLQNLTIWNKSNQSELANIGEAQIHLNVIDLILKQNVVPTAIVIDNVETTLEQSPDGHLQILGAEKQTVPSNTDMRLTLDWLFEHKKISLTNLTINMILANNQTVTLQDVAAVLTQEDQKVRVELAGTLYDTQQRGHLLLTALLDPNYLAQEKLNGEIALSFDEANIPSWLGLWPQTLPIHVEQGQGYVAIKSNWVDGKIERVQTSGAVQQIIINTPDHKYHVTGQQVSGHLDWNLQEGLLYIEGQELHLQIPEFYAQTTSLPGVASSLSWEQTAKGLLLNNKSVLSLIGEGEIISRGSILIPADKRKTEVEIFAQAKTLPILQSLAEYLPEKILSRRLVEWLNKSFLAGEINNAEMILRGPIYEFPFEKNQGTFEVVAQLADTDLKFNSKWPTLEHMNAQVIFDKNALTSNIHSGHIADGTITQGLLTIPELGKKGFDINVDGHINTTAEETIVFLKQTPLWESLQEKLGTLDLHGPVEVDLTLELPIDYAIKRKEKVLGNVIFNQGTVAMPSLDLAFTDVKGRLVFDEVGVYTNNITAQFFGEPVNVKLDSKKQINLPSFTELVISGKAKMTTLQEKFKHPFWYDMHGIMPFIATVEWRDEDDPKPSQMQIKSNLQGVKIDLPEPFGKTAEQIRALTYTSVFTGKKKQIKFNYNDIAQGDIFLSATKPQTITQGTISIPAKTPVTMPASGLKIVANLPTVDVELWQTIAKRYTTSSSTQSAPLPTIDAQLTTTKLHLLNRDLAIKFISAKSQNKAWNVSLSGKDVKGQIFIPNNLNAQPIKADLAYLYWPKSTSTAATQDMKPPPNDFPDFNVNIGKVVINDKDFGKVQAITEMGNNSLLIKKLSMEKPSFLLSGSGVWKWPNQKSVTSFKGTLTTKNLGQMLKDLNVSQGMTGGTGASTLNLNWPGSPFAWNLDTLNGEMTIDWHNGRLVDVKPGLGRILSLFSVRSITRRLRLDFSDVFKQGFTFDKVTANLLFNSGVVSTKNGSVTSTSGKITFDGKAYIPQEKLDLNVNVVPSVTNPSLPIAAGVAIANPIVGAAVWAVGSVVSPVTNHLASFSYRVTGPWQDPVIEQISSKQNSQTTKQNNSSKTTKK